MRVETMLKDIHVETNRTIDLVGDSIEATTACTAPVLPPERPNIVLASSSGFLTSRDLDGLVKCAGARSIFIQETRHVGESIVVGTPLALWWPDGTVAASPTAESDRATDQSLVTRFLQLITDLADTCATGEVRAELRYQFTALEQQLHAQTADPAATAEMVSAVAKVRARVVGAPSRPVEPSA